MSQTVVGDDPYLHQYFSRFQVTRSVGDSPRRVVFILGSTNVGGGTYVVLEHAQWLLDQGWDVIVAAMYHDAGTRWHPALDRVEVVSLEEAERAEFDVAIATWWPTAYELPRVRARHYVYLVQSVEARFYGEEEQGKWATALAELTYTFGLTVITIAEWIQLYLAMRHRVPALLVRNGIRKDVYNPMGPAVSARQSGRLRVLVEGPVDVPMKRVASAIALARAGGADEVWLMTGAPPGDGAGADRVFERVSVESTPTLYRSCDVLVKLSQVEGMYGPPLEMFHCGGTVVTYDVTGHEEYVDHGKNGLVVPMNDEQGVVDAIRSLKRDPALLSRLRGGALATAATWPDWLESSSHFGRLIASIAALPGPDNCSMLLAIRGAQRDFP
ncbi:MAG: glycosyltransferase family 4 protein [Ilumatobacteraceae bacterium]